MNTAQAFEGFVLLVSWVERNDKTNTYASHGTPSRKTILRHGQIVIPVVGNMKSSNNTAVPVKRGQHDALKLSIKHKYTMVHCV